MIIDLSSFDHHVSGGRPIYLLHTFSLFVILALFVYVALLSLFFSFFFFVIRRIPKLLRLFTLMMRMTTATIKPRLTTTGALNENAKKYD